jgi:hypothetical protein
MTASAMSQAAMLPSGYAEWIADVKRRIRAAQQRAALAVNKEMLRLYWQIGRDILDRQAVAGWGTGILGHHATDRQAAAGAGRQTSRDEDHEGFTRQEGAAVDEPATVEEGETMNGGRHVGIRGRRSTI